LAVTLIERADELVRDARFAYRPGVRLADTRAVAPVRLVALARRDLLAAGRTLGLAATAIRLAARVRTVTELARVDDVIAA
jgi:hypothetical protein